MNVCEDRSILTVAGSAVHGQALRVSTVRVVLLNRHYVHKKNDRMIELTHYPGRRRWTDRQLKAADAGVKKIEND